MKTPTVLCAPPERRLTVCLAASGCTLSNDDGSLNANDASNCHALGKPGRGKRSLGEPACCLDAPGEEIADARSAATIAGVGIHHKAPVKLTISIVMPETIRDNPDAYFA